MTEKMRGTTIQQRFGFKDDDLKKPLHDEIMMWLDANAEDVITELEGDKWSEKGIHLNLQEVAEAAKISGIPVPELGDPPPKPKPEIISKVWEPPIKAGNRVNPFVVGFPDMAITYRRACLWVDGLEWESSSYDSPSRLKGIESGASWRVSISNYTIYFEVKTTIKSLSELIRQVRMYQVYLRKHRFVVICPDDRFADVLKSQKIGFIKYAVGTKQLSF